MNHKRGMENLQVDSQSVVYNLRAAIAIVFPIWVSFHTYKVENLKIPLGRL